MMDGVNMGWDKGEWYKRRNGGLARFEGEAAGFPCFYHSDLMSDYGIVVDKTGNYMHRWNGEMMSSPQDRESCAPYDVVQNNGGLGAKHAHVPELMEV